MWNGTTPSLKAMPETMNTSPKIRKVCWDESLERFATCLATSVMVSVPVAP